MTLLLYAESGPRIRRLLIVFLGVCWLAGGGAHVSAEVVRMEIESRELFADGYEFGPAGGYEKITGKLYLEVDPENPANRRIADLKLAPRNKRGRVEFRTDFSLLKPADARRGNRRLLYDVTNRGNKTAIGAFNGQGGNNPTTREDAGNGFLLRRGFTILWCGWNGDVKPGDGRLLIGLPVAQEAGQPVMGKVYTEIVVEEKSFSRPLIRGNSVPYEVISLDNRRATLTMRPVRSAPPVEVPRDRWAFARWDEKAGRAIPDRNSLYVKDGFRPGWLYDLVYESEGPRVIGLGFAAVRDVVSFFRNESGDSDGNRNPLAGAVDYAYGFGSSQSGRFIQHFLMEGFNGDEKNRTVFDAAFVHVAGAGKGQFNFRFAQTTRHPGPHTEILFPADFFPFNSVPQKDPVTERSGDLLGRARRSGHLPKIFWTATSAEYWSRGASLLHTDVEGKRDAELDPNVRLYFFTGAQHGVSSSSERGTLQNPINVLNYRPLMRALLVLLDRWVATGEDPPASRYPRIADGTLVNLETYRKNFPNIPQVPLPKNVYAPLRLDPGPRWGTEGIADNVPPKVGPPFRTLVPAIDRDGNELAGVRLPDLAVPLGTYTGWNLRTESQGAAGVLAGLAGSYLVYPETEEKRKSSGDPRRSIRARYPARGAYLSKVAEAVLKLEQERFLLKEDVVEILRRAAQRNLWSK